LFQILASTERKQLKKGIQEEEISLAGKGQKMWSACGNERAREHQEATTRRTTEKTQRE
jgi:hypothetical protein